jgi:hypothetical protein
MKKGASAPFFMPAIVTLCYHYLTLRLAVLHFCNKTIANRYKTAYSSPTKVIWRYSFAVWRQCV